MDFDYLFIFHFLFCIDIVVRHSFARALWETGVIPPPLPLKILDLKMTFLYGIKLKSSYFDTLVSNHTYLEYDRYPKYLM